jgi:hypothetical protein
MLLGGNVPDETIYESGSAVDASAVQQDFSAPLHQAGAELGGPAPTLDVGGGDPNAGADGGEFGPPGEG